MSVRILNNPGTVHEVSDDIESFMHVAIWTSARYIPNTMTPEERSAFLANFDFQTADPGAGKKRILGMGPNTVDDLKLTTPGLVATMVKLMLAISYQHNNFSVQTLCENPIYTAEEVSKILSRMCTHDWMADTLKDALNNESWEVFEDPLEDMQLVVPVSPNVKRKKSTIEAYRTETKKQRINEDEESE